MNKTFDININHILAAEYLRNCSIPDDLIQATRILIDLKDLYQPIDQLIKNATAFEGDSELAKENYQKYSAKKIKELRQDKWIQLALTEDLDILNEDTAELKKLKKQAKANAKNNPNYRINGIKINHGFHLWVDYTLKPEELTKPLFDIFFAYKLGQVDLHKMYDFLKYQLVTNFANDKEKFGRYLKAIFRKYEKIIPVNSIITASEYMPEFKIIIDDSALGISNAKGNVIQTQTLTIPEAEITRTKNLKENLIRYNFYEFLKSVNKLDENKILKIEKLIFENDVPFIVALFNEINYLEYLKKEYCDGKAKKRDDILGEIFQVPPRRIKGNINVLYKTSEENRITYTSHQHLIRIANIIKGL